MDKYLKLFGTRLLVKEHVKEKKELEKTKSGLYIPKIQENPQDRLFTGEVIGIGDECTKVKVGQTVIYDRMQPAPFKLGEETYQMLDESNIIGVYENA